MFEALPGAQSKLPESAESAESANAKSITFHPAQIDAAAIAQVQANVRKRLLRAFVARGHLESHDAKDMAAYAHGGGFSEGAGVRIEATDRAGLERLLRWRLWACVFCDTGFECHTRAHAVEILILFIL